jgi:hypothetical protein
MMGTEMTEAYDRRGRVLLDAEREQLGKVRKEHIETESDTEQ